MSVQPDLPFLVPPYKTILETLGYREVISEREQLPSLVSQVIDQLLVFSILSQKSLL